MKKEKKKDEPKTFLNSVCDATRKQWFDNYDIDLMNAIRRIKLSGKWYTREKK